MPPKAPPGGVPASDDRRAVQPEQLRALIQMQRYPTAYVQRLVEHLSFLPDGGQKWEREVQMRLPTDPALEPAHHVYRGSPTMRPDAKQLFIVSMGMFTPARFADFTVRDAAGTRLSLLTRLQHGFCLTSAFIFKYFSEAQLPKANSEQPAFDELWQGIYGLFTTVNGASEVPLATVGEMTSLLVIILTALGAPKDEIDEKRARLETEYKTMQTVTQYLCWTLAEPGETISLSASYTMADAPRIRIPVPGSPPADGARFATLKRKWRQQRLGLAIRRTDFYAATGIGPLNYQLRTPAHDHSGSYYFLVEPPQNCKVSFLDWGLDNSIDDRGREVDCAFNSVHVHNGATMVGPGASSLQPRSSMPGSKISAFLRADFKDYWPLLIAAILTVLLAFLAQRGQFVARGDGISSVLLIAPTALLAYIAQRQSHHYAQATRWLGPLLIAYFLANVVFIASVQYDVLGGDTLFGRANALDDLISATIALASIGLFSWFVAINFRDRVIEHWFRGAKKPTDRVHRYSKLGLRYGDIVLSLLLLAFVGLLAGAIATGGFGWGAGRAHAVAAQKSLKATAVHASVSGRHPADDGVTSRSSRLAAPRPGAGEHSTQPQHSG